MNNSLKDYPIGAIIIYDNAQLMVMEQEGNLPICNGCYFNYERYRKYNKGKRISCITHRLACTKHMRKDKKHVYYKLMDE